MLAKHYPNDTNLRKPNEGLRSVLVTGAGGHIGTRFSAASKDRYKLKLMVHPDQHKVKIEQLKEYGDVVVSKLEDTQILKSILTGVDTIVHLAAEASPTADWESLHRDNIVGTYNLMQAAQEAGCRRVILASSIHAVSAYPGEEQIKTHEPVCPGDLYGVSKCFGEALARYMAEVHALSCIAIRIGGFVSRKRIRETHPSKGLDFWVSPRDLIQLIQRCIDNQDLLFAIFHGVSDNRFKRLDISDARELLGYAPVDDAFSELEDEHDWPND